MRKRERIAQLETQLAAVVEDRNRLSRQIHGYRAAQKQAAAADFRSREAIRRALDELFADRLTPLQRIVDAAQTLGRALDGRPPAAKPAAAPATPAPAPAAARLGSLDDIRAHGATRRAPAAGPLQPGVKL
jgi:hypothetical protein